MKPALLSVITLALFFTAGDPAMSPKVIEKMDGFTVVGISVRTSNAKEMTPDGLIGKQWDRLFREGLLDKIPKRANASIIAAYTDYASDKDGEYTYVLGTKVTSADSVPAGMVAVKVPAGRYAVFTSEKGPAPKIVVEIWQRIWAMPRSQPGGDRAYKTDFEVYDERAMDPQNGQVDVYIGTK
jgi:predicted transcriptional regulator YdeE